MTTPFPITRVHRNVAHEASFPLVPGHEVSTDTIIHVMSPSKLAERPNRRIYDRI
jgi:hypothetical protein